ncbi:hypothetical protein J6590_093446 [Homalodisca vitripennis]|nr:hypothetical protein J6590_093446 [Homalodisca vitripennis]
MYEAVTQLYRGMKAVNLPSTPCSVWDLALLQTCLSEEVLQSIGITKAGNKLVASF